MSVFAMAWAWNQDIKPSTKIVLLALSDHSDDKGTCWPGVKGIAKKSGYSTRQVLRKLKELQELGYIFIESRGGSGSGRKSNFYLLNMQSDKMSHRGQSDKMSHRGNVTSGVWQSDKGVTLPYKEEPSIEPSNNTPYIPQEIKSTKKTVAFELPSWVNAEAWYAYVEMRALIRKPMTDFAKQLAVVQLEGYEKQGHSHVDILHQSVECSYPKLYPVRKHETNKPVFESTTQRRQRIGEYIDLQARKAVERGLD